MMEAEYTLGNNNSMACKVTAAPTETAQAGEYIMELVLLGFQEDPDRYGLETTTHGKPTYYLIAPSTLDDPMRVFADMFGRFEDVKASIVRVHTPRAVLLSGDAALKWLGGIPQS